METHTHLAFHLPLNHVSSVKEKEERQEGERERERERHMQRETGKEEVREQRGGMREERQRRERDIQEAGRGGRNKNPGQDTAGERYHDRRAVLRGVGGRCREEGRG